MKARPFASAPPVYDREEYYESASRMIRWVCLALVLITYPSNSRYSLAVFTLILAIAAYNGLRYNKRLLKNNFFHSRINTLVVDHVFVLGLVFFSGGLASPYYPFFFILIIGIIASYGVAGFAISLAAQVVITPLMLTMQGTVLPASPEFQFIIKIIFLILFCLVAERSVRSRDEESLLERRFAGRIDSERQRLLALINALSSAVLAIDDRGKVYLYNAAALELLNTNRDITGQPISQLLPLHDQKYTTVDLFELLRQQSGQMNRQDLRYVPSDGSEMILDLTTSPVQAFDAIPGNQGGYMVVFRDITKQKTLDEERDEFIAVTSHELRTPLAITEANLSTALLPGFAKIEPKALTLINQAHDNVIFLSQLIKDLTTLSRAERGSLKIEKSLVDLQTLVGDLGRDYKTQAKAKNLRLEVSIDERTKQVMTSEPELREILQNFLTNAIKYTIKGTVYLKLEHHKDGATIRVKDSGIGISASDQAKIFSKFFRSEDYRTRATGGTGLGLYITKKLAQHLGIELDFSSQLNRGSTFSLTLPYHVPIDEAEQIAVTAQLEHQTK
jgi:two-component system, OmpR family, phosphate regulon sensor histidine kinase PhoR